MCTVRNGSLLCKIKGQMRVVWCMVSDVMMKGSFGTGTTRAIKISGLNRLRHNYESEVAGWCQCAPPLFGHRIF